MGVWHSFPRWDSARAKRKSRASDRQRGKVGGLGKVVDRRIESLESRMLLTSGPSLISIIPNDGSLLQPNDTIHTAPTQLTFRFLLGAGEALDQNTLSGIQLTRSGSDGVFGNANDPNSRVAKLKAEQRNYSILGELNSRPRTTYLAAVRNPNREMEKA